MTLSHTMTNRMILPAISQFKLILLNLSQLKSNKSK